MTKKTCLYHVMRLRSAYDLFRILKNTAGMKVVVEELKRLGAKVEI